MTITKAPAAKDDFLARNRIVSRIDTAALLNINVATLDRMVASGIFPKPIPVSTRRYGWKAGTSVDWLDARAAAKEPDAA